MRSCCCECQPCKPVTASCGLCYGALCYACVTTLHNKRKEAACTISRRFALNTRQALNPQTPVKLIFNIFTCCRYCDVSDSNSGQFPFILLSKGRGFILLIAHKQRVKPIKIGPVSGSNIGCPRYSLLSVPYWLEGLRISCFLVIPLTPQP